MIADIFPDKKRQTFANVLIFIGRKGLPRLIFLLLPAAESLSSTKNTFKRKSAIIYRQVFFNTMYLSILIVEFNYTGLSFPECCSESYWEVSSGQILKWDQAEI
jgi:hypothetical protein